MVGQARLALVVSLALTAVWVPVALIEPFPDWLRAAVIAGYVLVDAVNLRKCALARLAR